MFTAYVVLATLVASALVALASGAFTHNARIVHELAAVGVPSTMYPLLGSAELAGALGLLAGVAVPAFAVAACLGLIVYFCGAIVAHLRVHDGRGLAGPVVFLALAVVLLVLRMASAGTFASVL